jgi:hypothetical protein
MEFLFSCKGLQDLNPIPHIRVDLKQPLRNSVAMCMQLLTSKSARVMS